MLLLGIIAMEELVLDPDIGLHPTCGIRTMGNLYLLILGKIYVFISYVDIKNLYFDGQK